MPAHAALDSGFAELRLEPVELSLRASAASRRRPDEAFRVLLRVPREELQPPAHDEDRGRKEWDATYPLALRGLAFRTAPNDHVGCRIPVTEVLELEVPLLALADA